MVSMYIIAENQEWIDAIWEKVDKKLSRTAVKSRNKIPYTTINGEHDDRVSINPGCWTNGFWGGLMWLMYHETGNEEYRKTAERSEELLDSALRDYKSLHHDVGFMWHLTSGANYRLTGNQASCVRNLFAASTLFSRYNIDGDFIRAWNGMVDGKSTEGFRPDGSVNHIVNHEVDKIGVKEVLGGQGYTAESCWSRGLAWAVYGCVMRDIPTTKGR